MAKVLLVCPEPLAHGRPAGVGIRFLEMARVLSKTGHTVTLLSADGAGFEHCRTATTSPETVRRESRAHDVAVVQGHVANDFFAHAHPMPTVVDLYDPFIVENFHYAPDRGLEVFEHDHATLLASMGKGDFFLCASAPQRMFYLGILLATGRLVPDLFERDPSLESVIAIAPFGVPPPRERRIDSAARPSVLFGGIYDWYLPTLAIDAVAAARRSLPGLTLTFNRHPNAELPQSAATEAMKYVHQHGYGEFILFDDWVPYPELGAYYDGFAAALLTFAPSLETDLAMRTRVLDFLWGGLPVISSSSSGTDDLVERYEAGAVVRDSRPEDFAGKLVDVLSDRKSLEGMRRGAERFVADYQWDRTLQPLLSFCSNPRRPERIQPPESSRFVSPYRRSILKRFYDRLGGSR